MTNYVQPGHVMAYSNAGAAIASGAVVVLGDRIGIAMVDIAATSGSGSVSLDGVYSFAKDGDEAFTQGQQLYYDASDSTLTGTAAGNTPAGIAFEAAASAALTCLCRIGEHPNQAAVVAAVSTADGSDLATTQALANANKVAINAILVSLKAAGLMENV